LTDRLCTEVIGLDGRGGAATYASVGQWLAAYERLTEPQKPARSEPVAKRSTAKPKKLSFKEQQEWEGMEAAILQGEAALATCQAAVEAAATASHTVLAEACHAMEAAQQEVDRLYARWQQLEGMRSP
jgi:ATP-binding cassette subfamily F protein uup